MVNQPVTKGLFFDTATLYYRAFYAVPESITAPDGTPSGALRSFLDMVSTLYAQFPADNVVFAWDDDWRPQWRVDLLPSYKSHRVDEGLSDGENSETVPDNLGPQIAAIAMVLDAIGLRRIGEIGHEADDVLGALVRKHKTDCDVVTGDRDLFQLVDNTCNIRVISITKGLKNLEFVTDEFLEAKYGINGAQYADFALLRGDASDGLPGVKGIGEKTAAKLVAEFGTMKAIQEAALDAETSLAPAVRRNILESTAYLANGGQVVRVRTDAKISGSLAVPRKVKDEEFLAALIFDWGIERQVARLLKTMSIVR